MSSSLQLIISALIIAIAAIGLYRLLRRRESAESCGDCPVKELCKEKNQKKSAKSCKGQK